eukprot:6511803-Alexandrium_andersonii.AAC.1
MAILRAWAVFCTFTHRTCMSACAHERESANALIQVYAHTNTVVQERMSMRTCACVHALAVG